MDYKKVGEGSLLRSAAAICERQQRLTNQSGSTPDITHADLPLPGFTAAEWAETRALRRFPSIQDREHACQVRRA